MTTTTSQVDPDHIGSSRRRSSSSSRAPGRLPAGRSAGAAGGPPSSAGHRPPSRGSRTAAGRTGGRAGGAASQGSSRLTGSSSAARQGSSGSGFASATDDPAQQHIISQTALDDMQSMYAGGDWAAGTAAEAGFHHANVYHTGMSAAEAYTPDWGDRGSASRQAARESSQLDNPGRHQPPVTEQAYPTTSSGTAAPPLLSSTIMVTPAVVAAGKRGFVPIGTLPLGAGIPTAVPASAAPSAVQPLLTSAPSCQQQLQQPPRQQQPQQQPAGYNSWQSPEGMPLPPPLPSPDRSPQHWLHGAAAPARFPVPTEQRSGAAAGVPGAHTSAGTGRGYADAASSQQPAAVAAGAWQEPHATGRRRGIGDDQLQVRRPPRLWLTKPCFAVGSS